MSVVSWSSWKCYQVVGNWACMEGTCSHMNQTYSASLDYMRPCPKAKLINQTNRHINSLSLE